MSRSGQSEAKRDPFEPLISATVQRVACQDPLDRDFSESATPPSRNRDWSNQCEPRIGDETHRLFETRNLDAAAAAAARRVPVQQRHHSGRTLASKRLRFAVSFAPLISDYRA